MIRRFASLAAAPTYPHHRYRVLYFYPYLHFDTGSPKTLVEFMDALDRRVFEPVFCAHGTGPLTKVIASRGIEILPMSNGMISWKRPLAGMTAIWRQARLLKEHKIDLVHANCFPWNTDLLLAAKVARIPLILHVQNRLDVGFQNLVRFAASKVLFCSETEKRHCGHLNRIAGKAEVLHNLIDVDVWATGHCIREDLGLARNEIAIGTVAQIVRRKGIDLLLKTARLVLRERKDVVFLIVGPQMAEEREYGEQMRAIARQPEFAGRVRFLGSRTDIPDVMASLDLFVLPTRAEPFGLVMIEAMAAGVPVIASKVGGIPEIVTSPEIGTLVDPLTPEAFANAIREVLARPDRGRYMGAQGRRSLKGRFDTASGGERLKKIYQEVLGSRPPSRCWETSA